MGETDLTGLFGPTSGTNTSMAANTTLSLNNSTVMDVTRDVKDTVVDGVDTLVRHFDLSKEMMDAIDRNLLKVSQS